MTSADRSPVTATVPDLARQHITPKSYLAALAENGVVSAHFVDDGRVTTVSIRDAAVRKHIYSFKLPDGTHNVDLERRIGALESAAVPLLRTLERDWPLTIEQRAVVAEFIALQIVRGPVWRRWADERGRAVVAEKRGAQHDFAPEKWG